MDIPDPTGARLRDFDIPVILPRFAFKELPEPAAPVTTATCAPVAPAPLAATPLTASAGLAAPVVKLGLPVSKQRRSSVLRTSGLAFAVSSDKRISDVEVRLVQLLPDGKKRPLAVTLQVPEGPFSAHLVLIPTPFARGKLALRSKGRAVRAIAIVTAQDGSVGQAYADFKLV